MLCDEQDELCRVDKDSCYRVRLFWLLTVGLQYFIQHGYHVITLNFVARSHFSFIDYMFYDASTFVKSCHKNNINVLFIVSVASADH